MQGCLKALHRDKPTPAGEKTAPDHNLETINAGKELTAALSIPKPDALGMTKTEGKKEDYITCRNYERP